MKMDIPREFYDEYQAKFSYFDETIEQITALLKKRLGQLAARMGVRGRITDYRIKRPAKIWENVKKMGLNSAEALIRVEDILGIRVVCNNLSDISPIVEMIRSDFPILEVLDIKDMVSSPYAGGYRATHVRTQFVHKINQDQKPTSCEIQIRTLSQDTWARLSREDLYGKDVPSSIQRLAIALATQLSAIDEIAQLIRDELNQCPPIAKEIKDCEFPSPQRLALLYRDRFGEELYEWSLVDWVKQLGVCRAYCIKPDIANG